MSSCRRTKLRLALASAEIFPGGKRQHFDYYHFQVADYAMQRGVHNTLTPFYTNCGNNHKTNLFT